MKACDFWFVSLHCLETPLLAYIGKSRSPSRTFEVSVMSGSLSVGYQRWEISSQVLRHFRFSRSSDVGPMLTWALISLHKLGAKLGLGNHGENLYIKARCLQNHRSRAIIRNVAQHQRSPKKTSASAKFAKKSKASLVWDEFAISFWQVHLGIHVDMVRFLGEWKRWQLTKSWIWTPKLAVLSSAIFGDGVSTTGTLWRLVFALCFFFPEILRSDLLCRRWFYYLLYLLW